MTVAGWIFLAVSLVFVWGLAISCYYRVLTLPPRQETECDEEPEESSGA